MSEIDDCLWELQSLAVMFLQIDYQPLLFNQTTGLKMPIFYQMLLIHFLNQKLKQNNYNNLPNPDDSIREA